MTFGLCTGMMILPTILVKPEDALTLQEFTEKDNPVVEEKRKRFFEFAKKNPDLNSRFISMFDEMDQAGLFGKETLQNLKIPNS